MEALASAELKLALRRSVFRPPRLVSGRSSHLGTCRPCDWFADSVIRFAVV